MQKRNTVVRFAKTPAPGPLERDVFTWEQSPIPVPKDGEVLVRTLYLSIDAGSRAQLDDRGEYVIKAALGSAIISSGGVFQVVESRHGDWRSGDILATTVARWQSYQIVSPIRQLAWRVDPQDGPLTLHLGLLGMVGFTAYIGILEVARPQHGETILVSAAAGATGALAGQFAKIHGARVIGIAGGAQKCAFVKETLGFDDCIDYQAGDLHQSIRAACPEGIDVYYENVGGGIQQAAFAQMNDFGRIAMCGMVGQYSGQGAPAGPNLMSVVLKRLKVTGFLANDHIERHAEFVADATRWYREGKLQHHETVTSGLEHIHEAINSLTAGRNFGKQVCRVADVLPY
ncbi:NADP-dependent oxidoreductase [Pseudomonas silvicola]|nr:NADP-dependent oxidoreductase [Pseudomonas silvicola]